MAGGVASAPGHCLGRVHRDVIPPTNTSASPCGLTDLRAPSAAASQRVSPLARVWFCYLRAGWRRLVRLSNRLDDSWVGDLIGVVCLFGMLWPLLLLAAVLE